MLQSWKGSRKHTWPISTRDRSELLSGRPLAEEWSSSPVSGIGFFEKDRQRAVIAQGSGAGGSEDLSAGAFVAETCIQSKQRKECGLATAPHVRFHAQIPNATARIQQFYVW